MDPAVETLIAQGYPPEVAQRMVESGAYSAMTNPLQNLPNLMGGPSGATPQLNQQVPDNLQYYTDQGYNIEEAEQLAASENYSLGNEEAPVDTAKRRIGGNTNAGQPSDIQPLLGAIGNAGAGVSLEGAAHSLGRAIGAEKGAARTVSIIGSAGKLALGTARGIASGLGQMKRNRYVQDYYDKKRIEEMTDSDNYTPAPQSGNVNYLGGNSYGEQGGIQGETLPLKSFLKSGGFKKTGFKKLM